MQIAIIGAGNVGKALAGAAVRAGRGVVMSAGNPDEAKEAARLAGARAAGSNPEAVRGADAVILAVPTPALDAVLSELGPHLEGKTIIDVTNRVNPADPGSVLDGPSNAEQIQTKVPGAHVVKAFNTVLAARQADPVIDGVEADGFVPGDDAPAKAAVLELVRSLGFRPIDAGPLVMARVLEGMALLNILLQIWNDWPWQTTWKLVGPTGQQP